jgi:hypothetical protein
VEVHVVTNTAVRAAVQIHTEVQAQAVHHLQEAAIVGQEVQMTAGREGLLQVRLAQAGAAVVLHQVVEAVVVVLAVAVAAVEEAAVDQDN